MSEQDFTMPDGNGKASLAVYKEGEGFIFQIEGWGFEAFRIIDAYDLRELRDWINRELGEES